VAVLWAHREDWGREDHGPNNKLFEWYSFKEWTFPDPEMQ